MVPISLRCRAESEDPDWQDSEGADEEVPGTPPDEQQQQLQSRQEAMGVLAPGAIPTAGGRQQPPTS